MLHNFDCLQNDGNLPPDRYRTYKTNLWKFLKKCLPFTIRGKTYGTRAFIYATPHEWNKLLFFIRKNINLKTYLFKLAFLFIYFLFVFLDMSFYGMNAFSLQPLNLRKALYTFIQIFNDICYRIINVIFLLNIK